MCPQPQPHFSLHIRGGLVEEKIVPRAINVLFASEIFAKCHARTSSGSSTKTLKKKKKKKKQRCENTFEEQFVERIESQFDCLLGHDVAVALRLSSGTFGVARRIFDKHFFHDFRVFVAVHLFFVLSHLVKQFL